MQYRSKTFKVRVTPNAKSNRIRESGDGLKVYIAAPPVEGKANKALLKLLAEHFHVKRSHLTILKGKTSRDKLIRVKNG